MAAPLVECTHVVHAAQKVAGRGQVVGQLRLQRMHVLTTSVVELAQLGQPPLFFRAKRLVHVLDFADD